MTTNTTHHNTMRAINRIPQLDSTLSLGALVSQELNFGNIGDTATELQSAIDHCAEEDMISCMMDWAMQLRMELGISWGDSINAAMILYYG